MKHRPLIALLYVLTIVGILNSSVSQAAVAAKPQIAAPAPTVTAGARIDAVTRNESTAKTTVALASDGKALVPIVIAAKASDATKGVAAELAGYLKRITGAEFEVKPGDGAHGIVLGTSAEFPTPELAGALQIFPNTDGREAFAIRTTPGKVLLLGATEKGVPHAAFRFLRELGYRHFFPHPAWEVVPHIEDLRWNKNITDRPSVLSRNIWFEAGSGGPAQNRDYVDWKRHNFQAESFVVNAEHNLDVVIRLNQAAFDAHPEYYAARKQADGSLKRDPASLQLELANPVVRQMVVQYAIGFFKKNPSADMVSIDPADNMQDSQSPESLKLGSTSDRIFGLANEVAKALAKEYPGQGKMVGLLSYNSHWDPPTFPLEPNVHVLLSNLGEGELKPAQREKVWTQRSHNLGYYEYYSVWLWSYDKLPGSWVNYLPETQRRVRQIVANGGTSVNAESTSSWGSNGRGYYVINSLLWNPDQDVDALAMDFYEKAFGPAAPAMKKYYDHLDPVNTKFLSKHLIGTAARDLQQATELAKDRPDVIARLDQLKMYLFYIYYDWMRNRDAATPGDKRNALDTTIMTNLFRTRAYALTSWEMIRQRWGGNAEEGRDKADWMIMKPYSRQEIDETFNDMLAYFQLAKIGEPKGYSEDLVAIDWGKTFPADSVEHKQVYQGNLVYALYSAHGEPLEFTTWAGDAWGGINSFVLRDAHGNVVFTKEKIPNKATTRHRVAVPGPGVYFLNYDDKGSYWAMIEAPGGIASIPMGQTLEYRNMEVMKEMYFYVPKGTKNIEYYYAHTAFHPGGPHNVVDPTGKVVKSVNVDGDWVNVPVPAGQDGQIWKFENPVLGMFWFNAIPNYLAASPAGLLVPREVAIADGLTIRK